MDLNMMMREQAKTSLERELEDAVTNGDTKKAKEVTDKLSALAVANAPPPPPYGPDAIKAELEKTDWFGVDPEKTTFVIEQGKNLNIKKFPTAAAFAKALLDAVEKKFASPAAGGGDSEGDNEGDGAGEGEDEGDGAGEGEKKPKPKQRSTDGPGEGDHTQRNNTRRGSGGPWTKITDAPADVQREINRTADKFAGTDKKKREGFVARALESHYAVHQRKGKK